MTDNAIVRAAAATKPVRGYVKAVLAHRRLKARLDAKLAALEPLQRRVRNAAEEVKRREGRFRGGQHAAAERLLALEPDPLHARLAALAAPKEDARDA